MDTLYPETDKFSIILVFFSCQDYLKGTKPRPRPWFSARRKASKRLPLSLRRFHSCRRRRYAYPPRRQHRYGALAFGGSHKTGGSRRARQACPLLFSSTQNAPRPRQISVFSLRHTGFAVSERSSALSFPISAVSLPAGQAFSCSPWSRSRPSLAERAYPQLLPVEPKPLAPRWV